MKKCLLVLIALIPSYSFGQNVVTLLRTFGRANSASICRTINVPPYVINEAIGISMYQNANRYKIDEIGCRLNIQLEKDILLESIKEPTTIYGPYNYLRAYTRLSREQKFVNKKFADDWRKITKVNGYNGVHHLISKGTIKLIYEDLKREGKEISLIDMENNAPAIFHPLHGNPEYKDIFHNIDEQYYDYKRFGMKVTIISLLERIDEANIKIGAKPFPKWYLKGVLKEAELWCKYYGINWE